MAAFYIAEILQILQKHAGARGCRQRRSRQAADQRRLACTLGERCNRPNSCGPASPATRLLGLEPRPPFNRSDTELTSLAGSTNRAQAQAPVRDDQNRQRPPGEILHLIRKLRWLGMDEEAEDLHAKLQKGQPRPGAFSPSHAKRTRPIRHQRFVRLI